MQYGTTSPEVLVEASAALGFSACALTDRDGLYGAIRHIRACIAHRIAPIVGAELLVEVDGELNTITVLAHGNNHGSGWATLCRIISATHSHRWQSSQQLAATRRRPQMPAKHLQRFFSDLRTPECTVLLSPDSNVGRAVAAGDTRAARRYLEDWKQLLNRAVAVEIVCHYTEPGTLGSLSHAAATVQLASSCGVDMALTNAVRMLTPSDVVTADLLAAAKQLSPLDETRSTPNAQAWLKPAETMLATLAEIGSQPGVEPHALAQLLRHTEQLSQQCQLNPEQDLKWRQAKLPEASVAGIRENPIRMLTEHTHAMLRSKYADLSPSVFAGVHDRLQRELKTITRFGFASYFLTVADVTRLIRSLGIRVQARGSGAGSLVNFLLGISSVDPVAHDLLFERFLSSNRETLPDIDLDVESARRHEIYRAIVDKYGHTRVTLLSMRTGYRARSATRDTGRALGLPEDEVDRLAKHLWRVSARDLRAALAEKPELREVAERVRTNAKIDQLVDLIGRIDRLPRHLSLHPCGVILSNTDLLSTTPVQPSGIGMHMSQFDKDDIDDIGFLKLDVLGVRMQSAMAHSLGEIKRVRGAAARASLPRSERADIITDDGTLKLDDIRLDDPETFATIRTTHTLGMFQIESPGQRELAGKLQPTEFEDLIAEISLFRPGPMKANMIAPFVDARHGITDPDYLHPRFVTILKPTFGVVIYHEQVIRILADCMGITLSQADEYRRQLSVHTEQIEHEFRATARLRRDSHTGKRLFTDRDIDRLWRALESFGSFGFCKAHGAAFALPTYQTAWLKTHFAPEFFAGLLTHDPGMYPKRLLLTEAKRLGIPILGIDVNMSRGEYVVEPNQGRLGIRVALCDIRHITQAEISRIEHGQPYRSRQDFIARARPSQRLLNALERLGALAQLPHESTTHSPAAHVSEDPAMQKPNTDEQHQQVHTELELLNLDVSGHVLQPYQHLLEELGVTPADSLINLPNKTEVLVAGIRVATQTPPMRSGKRVVFISLDDGTGCADVTFFDEAQRRAGPLLFMNSLLLVAGKTRRTGARGISLIAEQAWSLSAVAHEYGERIQRRELSPH